MDAAGIRYPIADTEKNACVRRLSILWTQYPVDSELRILKSASIRRLGIPYTVYPQVSENPKYPPHLSEVSAAPGDRGLGRAGVVRVVGGEEGQVEENPKVILVTGQCVDT